MKAGEKGVCEGRIGISGEGIGNRFDQNTLYAKFSINM